MLKDEVIKCSFSQWYSIFGHLSIESEIIKLDQKFIDYILSDYNILPVCCNSESKPQNTNDDFYNDDYENLEDQNGNGNGNVDEDEDEEEEEIPIIEFPQIEREMRRCLRRFNSVFPKLNWSSCEDAKWITAFGTKCTDLTTIFLLLKSSDQIVFDLTNPFSHCSDYDELLDSFPKNIQYELILRKWIDINPSMEFRCFCLNNKLIGICQRDVRTYYDYIGQDKTNIINDIQTFFLENIAGKFTLENFVMDILRPTNETIILIDINPFGKITDSLLFDWDELYNFEIETSSETEIDFRYIKDQFGIQRSRFQLNSLPLDVFNGNLTNVFDDSSIR